MQLRLEGQRQGEQGTVEVEGGQSVPRTNHTTLTRQALHQPEKRRGHLEHHLGATCLYQGDVPAKLNAVAEALFRMQQNGLALQRGIALPKRLGKFSILQAEFGALPAPLVLTPSALEITCQKAAQPFIQVCIRILRVQSERFFIAVQRLPRAVEASEYGGTVYPAPTLCGCRLNASSQLASASSFRFMQRSALARLPSASACAGAAAMARS